MTGNRKRMAAALLTGCLLIGGLADCGTEKSAATVGGNIFYKHNGTVKNASETMQSQTFSAQEDAGSSDTAAGENTTDLFSSLKIDRETVRTIQIDGQTLQMPCTVGELTALGYTLVVEDGLTVDAEQFETDIEVLNADGKRMSFHVNLYNAESDTQKVQDCAVDAIYQFHSQDDEMAEIKFADVLEIGASIDDVEAAIGEPTMDYTESAEYGIAMFIDLTSGITLSAGYDLEDRKIILCSISCYGSSRE